MIANLLYPEDTDVTLIKQALTIAGYTVREDNITTDVNYRPIVASIGLMNQDDIVIMMGSNISEYPKDSAANTHALRYIENCLLLTQLLNRQNKVGFIIPLEYNSTMLNNVVPKFRIKQLEMVLDMLNKQAYNDYNNTPAELATLLQKMITKKSSKFNYA